MVKKLRRCVKSYEIFNLIFEPLIEIEDMSVRGFETISYHVHELEGSFDFFCKKIEYWYQEP